MRYLRRKLTDPQKFAAVGLIITVAIVAATGFAGSSFFRRAIVKHESAIFSEMVQAIVNRDEPGRVVTTWDFEHYADKSAQAHLAHTFGLLEKLPGFVRIKIFRPDQIIVWSDVPRLIGTNFTHHRDELIRALAGDVRVVFNAQRGARTAETLPQNPLLELYVPFTVHDASTPTGEITGVLSIYRLPVEINNTIKRGLYLLWIVAGLGGLILYAALYRLFYAVYYSRQTLETRLNTLTDEHGRLMQIEKLSALGQMVGEIAHQLNNPLVGVINLTQLAERDSGNPQRMKELLGEIRKAGEHCRSVVQRMLRINRIPHPELQSTDMNMLADETVHSVQAGSGAIPSIKLQKSSEPITLEVDPVLIRNALFNLIHNAIQAAPTGPVTVSLAPTQQNGTAGCQIAVSDCGPGISADAADKLFDPLFTTRPGGTGLGLSIARHIVALHRGNISAANKPGGGAIFTIWLPAQRPADDGKNIAR
jgi:signal transduction histidine kinase